MSSYMCNEDHLTAIACAAVLAQVAHLEISEARIDESHLMRVDPNYDGALRMAAKKVFRALASENAAAMAKAYPLEPRVDVRAFTLHTPTADTLGLGRMFPTHPNVVCMLPALRLLKAIDCYEYQACESPTWETSRVKTICEELRAKLIRLLPGYNDAAWGWS